MDGMVLASGVDIAEGVLTLNYLHIRGYFLDK